MPRQITGLQIRPPHPAELESVAEWFADSNLARQNAMFLAAFGRPGNRLLGAVMVQADRDQGTGHFAIHVRLDYRRKQIGTLLMQHLYRMALANDARRLVMSELVHEDLPENTFYLAMGLTPERSMKTYTTRREDCMRVLYPLAERFSRTHPHLVGCEVVPLSAVDAAEVGRFFSEEYGIDAGLQIDAIHRGYFDPEFSCAIVKAGNMVAGGLVRRRADNPHIMVDLLLAAPALRNGPAAVVLCAHITRGMERHGLAGATFEADERHDSFATSLAKRCGAPAKWQRHRYSIDGRGMASQLANGSVTPPRPRSAVTAS